MTHLIPTSEADLAEAIQAASAPLAICGGQSKGITCDGAPLSTTGMTGINEYEPGALTMIAKAGTPLAEIEAALDAEGQRLAFEPYDYQSMLGTTGTSTIGGVFAMNNSGSRRFQSGAARDFLLGVRFVDGTGQILKNGGRVMKNVTGYDLVKLLCGSFGTLGVMTEVAFKTLPKSETQTSLVLHGLSEDQAVGALTRAVGSPFEVSGAVHLPFDADGPKTVLRIEGFEKSVSYRLEQLQGLMGGYDHSHLEGAQSRALWSDIRALTPVSSKDDAIWKVSVKPTDGASVFQKAGFTSGFMDWSGGLLWGSGDQSCDPRAAITEGHATLIKGDHQPKFHPENPLVAAYSAKIRQKFDPRGILNQGLMG